MTRTEFLARTRRGGARDDADIYIPLANGDWVLVADVEVATAQVILLHPLAEAAP